MAIKLSIQGMHDGVFPGVSSCLIDLRLRRDESVNLEMPLNADKNISKSILSLDKGSEKEKQKIPIKLSNNSHSALVKHHGKKLSTFKAGEPGPFSLQAVIRSPTTAIGEGVSGAK